MEREHAITAITAWNDLRGLLNHAALADRMKLHRSSVSQWRVVPKARVEDVAAITGIQLHRLRPDLYPPPADPMPWQKS